MSEVVRARVRAQARNRCGYFQSQQQYVLGLLEIDHIVPTARGGTDDEENLWLACRLCNGFKGTQAEETGWTIAERTALPRSTTSPRRPRADPCPRVSNYYDFLEADLTIVALELTSKVCRFNVTLKRSDGVICPHLDGMLA